MAGGFSFGGAVAVRAAAAAAPEGLVLVAPAVNRLDVLGEPAPACPWLIVQGDADEVVAAAQVLEWAQALKPPPVITVLPETGHFFHGRLNELRGAVVTFLEQLQHR